MARRGNDVATQNWAIAELGAVGAASLGYNAYELVNRVNGLGVELAVYSGGIGTSLPQWKVPSFNLSGLSYNYFFTRKPMTFSDFDRKGAFVAGINLGVWSGSRLEVYNDERLGHLIKETFTGFGVGIPSADIGNGLTSIIWDSMSVPIGRVQRVLPVLEERKRRFPDVVYVAEGKKLKLQIAAQALFAFDSATLDLSDVVLHQAGKLLCSAKNIQNVLIEGHTDSVGAGDYNLHLSLRRAEAVAEFFKRHGYLSDIPIAVRGKGENEPIASNLDARGRSMNRRVTVSAVVK